MRDRVGKESSRSSHFLLAVIMGLVHSHRFSLRNEIHSLNVFSPSEYYARS